MRLQSCGKQRTLECPGLVFTIQGKSDTRAKGHQSQQSEESFQNISDADLKLRPSFIARICQAFGVTLQPDTKPPGTWLHAPDTAGSMWVHVVDRNLLDREMSAKSYEDLSCAAAFFFFFFCSSQKSVIDNDHKTRQWFG